MIDLVSGATRKTGQAVVLSGLVLDEDSTGRPQISLPARPGQISAVAKSSGTLTTGTLVRVPVPSAMTITKVQMLSKETGSAVVDIWKDTYANYPPTAGDSICGGSKPTLSSASKMEDSTLSGWTTSFATGDILVFNLDSVTSITELTVTLFVSIA